MEITLHETLVMFDSSDCSGCINIFYCCGGINIFYFCGCINIFHCCGCINIFQDDNDECWCSFIMLPWHLSSNSGAVFEHSKKGARISLLMMMIITFKSIYIQVPHNTCKSLQPQYIMLLSDSNTHRKIEIENRLEQNNTRNKLRYLPIESPLRASDWGDLGRELLFNPVPTR